MWNIHCLNCAYVRFTLVLLKYTACRLNLFKNSWLGSFVLETTFFFFKSLLKYFIQFLSLLFVHAFIKGHCLAECIRLWGCKEVSVVCMTCWLAHTVNAGHGDPLFYDGNSNLYAVTVRYNCQLMYVYAEHLKFPKTKQFPEKMSNECSRLAGVDTIQNIYFDGKNLLCLKMCKQLLQFYFVQ